MDLPPQNVALIEFNGSYRDLLQSLQKLLGSPTTKMPPEDHPYWHSTEFVAELRLTMGKLDALSSPGYRFGPSDWDGFCFGYWRINK